MHWSSLERSYLATLARLAGPPAMDAHGWEENRTGVRTRRLPAQTLAWSCGATVAAMRHKPIHLHSVLRELEWMIQGHTNVSHLRDRGVRIWNEWADENGDLGPVYGAQWRGTHNGVDQLQDAVNLLRSDPSSRRILVNSWQCVDLPNMRLPPCHLLFQFVSLDSGPQMPRQLHTIVTQRSADILLGVPFNILAYDVLTRVIAHITGHAPASVTMNFGDLHLYENHLEAARTAVSRVPPTSGDFAIFVPPNNCKELDDITYGSLRILGYDPCPEKITAPVAV